MHTLQQSSNAVVISWIHAAGLCVFFIHDQCCPQPIRCHCFPFGLLCHYPDVGQCASWSAHSILPLNLFKSSPETHWPHTRPFHCLLRPTFSPKAVAQRLPAAPLYMAQNGQLVKYDNLHHREHCPDTTPLHGYICLKICRNHILNTFSSSCSSSWLLSTF